MFTLLPFGLYRSLLLLPFFRIQILNSIYLQLAFFVCSLLFKRLRGYILIVSLTTCSGAQTTPTLLHHLLHVRMFGARIFRSVHISTRYLSPFDAFSFFALASISFLLPPFKFACAIWTDIGYEQNSIQ